jgi:hypothetical protein
MLDPHSFCVNAWLAQYSGLDLQGLSPCEFPRAFFTDADDPAANLVLTGRGGSLAAPEALMLALGAPMSVTSIEMEGENLRVEIWPKGAPAKVELSEPWTSCCIQGQFLALKIVAGVLNGLKLKGTPLVQVKSALKVEARRMSEAGRINAKLTLRPQKQQIVLDLGRAKQLTGVVFKELTGARSIVFAFFIGEWHGHKNKPVATDHYYIPETEPQFRLRFKPIVPVKVVQIQFCDILAGFALPKVELF